MSDTWTDDTKRLSVVRRLIVIAVILGAAGTAAGVLMATRPRPEQAARQDTGLLVEVERVEPGVVTMMVEGYGTVEPKRQVTETAEVSGRITFMSPCLDEGMYFQKGQLLLEIDPRTYTLAVERLTAQLAAAEAERDRLIQEQQNNEASLLLAREDVALAERELERQKDLKATSVAAEAAVEAAQRAVLAARTQQQRIENTLASLKAQLAAAEAQTAMARANLKEAKLTLEKTRLYAPFNGRTMEKFVEEGQFVTIGARLVTLYDTSSLEVTVNLPYEDLRWLDLSHVATAPGGDTADSATTVPLNFDPSRLPSAIAVLEAGGSQWRWQGVVTRLAGVVDRSTRTVPVIVEFHAPWSSSRSAGGQPPLMPGMFVRVELEGRRYEQIYTIPRGALRDDDSIYLASEDQLIIRQAQLLRTTGNLAYISAGLQPGDQLIVSPMATAVAGMKIRVAASGTVTSGVSSDVGN